MAIRSLMTWARAAAMLAVLALVLGACGRPGGLSADAGDALLGRKTRGLATPEVAGSLAALGREMRGMLLPDVARDTRGKPVPDTPGSMPAGRGGRVVDVDGGAVSCVGPSLPQTMPTSVVTRLFSLVRPAAAMRWTSDFRMARPSSG